jgi:uncharacterized protein YceK
MIPRLSRLVTNVLALTCMCLPGCATYRTVSAAEPGTPKLFSGTRLDLKAIDRDEHGAARFRAPPPNYPWLDLAFSAVVDTFILPLTFPVATYELLFR